MITIIRNLRKPYCYCYSHITFIHSMKLKYQYYRLQTPPELPAKRIISSTPMKQIPKTKRCGLGCSNKQCITVTGVIVTVTVTLIAALLWKLAFSTGIILHNLFISF